MINLTSVTTSLDSVLFLVTSIIFIVWIASKKLDKKIKVVSFIFFLGFNSSYNIMVKQIHDFNILIPRNFIWNFDLLGPLSVYDTLFLAVLACNIKFLINQVIENQILRLLYTRDLTIIILGTISYILFQGYWLDGGNNYLLTMKGLIFFTGSLALTMRYLSCEFRLSSYLFPITLILISGFLSLNFFPDDELWVRYGQVIKIIDQEDAYTISLFAITLLAVYLIYPKTVKNKKIYILFFFVLTLQNILSIYKTNFVYLLFLLIMIPIVNFSKRVFVKWVLTMYLVFSLSLISINSIASISTSQSIFTRAGQITDYFTYINEHHSMAHFVGLGIGAPYKAMSDTGDLGEVKIIDKESSIDPSYKFVYQIPVLSIYKNSGLFGLITFVILWAVLTLRGLKDIKKIKRSAAPLYTKVELTSIIIYLTYFSLFWGSVMLGGTTPFFIFLGVLIGRYCIISKRYLKHEFKDL